MYQVKGKIQNIYKEECYTNNAGITFRRKYFLIKAFNGKFDSEFMLLCNEPDTIRDINQLDPGHEITVEFLPSTHVSMNGKHFTNLIVKNITW